MYWVELAFWGLQKTRSLLKLDLNQGLTGSWREQCKKLLRQKAMGSTMTLQVTHQGTWETLAYPPVYSGGGRGHVL